MKRQSILVLAMVVLLAASTSVCAYSGGDGSADNPYRIATAEDLNDIGNHIEDFNKCFIMTADISLADYNDSQFNVIGPNSTTPFTGIFDGNGHTISNLVHVGSGAVEGACKNVVGKRLKQSGMIWTRLGSSSVLALRTHWLNYSWEQLWEKKPLAA